MFSAVRPHAALPRLRPIQASEGGLGRTCSPRFRLLTPTESALSRSVAETSGHPCASSGCEPDSQGQADREAAMLQRIPLQESEAIEKLRTFDPEVSGWIFWPIIFGLAGILGQLVITIR